MEDYPKVGTTYHIACYVEGVNANSIGSINVTLNIAGEKVTIPFLDWIAIAKNKEE